MKNKHIKSFNDFLFENVKEEYSDISKEMVEKLDELASLIKKTFSLKINPKNLNLSFNERNDFIEITSADIKDELGPLGDFLYKNFFIKISGGTKIQNDGSFYFFIDVRFDLSSGGSNGQKLARSVSFTPNQEKDSWKINL